MLFYLGLVLLVIAIASPVDFYSERYLSLHMLQHILLGFLAPPLIVLGAPWLPLLSGLPRPARQWVGHLVQKVRQFRARHGWWRGATQPLVPIVLFNVAMLVWHLPVAFDLAARNQLIHIWVEHATFFGLALLLWLQLMGSYPLRPSLPPLAQAGAAFGTNAVMVLTAMTLVLFTHDLYPVYHHLLGAGLSQDADQQIAGSTLWICGEASLAPILYFQVHRWLAMGERRAAKAQSGWTAPSTGWRAVTGKQWR